VEIRLIKSDLPPTSRKNVQEAVRLLYEHVVKEGAGGKRGGTKAAKWAEFARSLQLSLNQSLKPSWHVFVGVSIGFACKKRDKSMGIWRIDQSCMVVVYKSPGIEAPAPLPPPDAAASGASEEATEGNGAAGAPAMKILEPSPVEAGSDAEKITAVIGEGLRKHGNGDVQKLAQQLRIRLTEEFGTIWHVITGEEFVTEVAEDRRNFVSVVAGKKRVVCFQHEEFTKGFSLAHIDWDRLLKALPYFLLAVFCFAYMTSQSVCQDSAQITDSAWRGFLQRNLCHETGENRINAIGVCALASFFLGRKSSLLAPFKGKQKTV